MDKLIDRVLGLRCSTYGYQYSEILSSVFYTYYCGGDHIENIGHHLSSHLELRPETHIPSPDTVLRGIKELATVHGYCYNFYRGKGYSTQKKSLNRLSIFTKCHFVFQDV